MKTVTVTQEEYNGWLKDCYNDKVKFEADLRKTISLYGPIKDKNVKAYERYTKAKLMLGKLTFEKYDVKSIEIDGKGVDRYITYMEYKDGTPLNTEELEGLESDMQWDLMSETYN